MGIVDWAALQAEFQALSAPLRFERLDFQGGAAGEYWRLAGGADPVVLRQFEAIAELAGAALLESLATRDHPELVAERCARDRWYRALKERTGLDQVRLISEQTAAGGEAALIYAGSIDRVIDASILLCQMLRAVPNVPTEIAPPDAASTDEKIFELKPSVWGISIDLRAFWRWLRRAKVDTK